MDTNEMEQRMPSPVDPDLLAPLVEVIRSKEDRVLFRSSRFQQESWGLRKKGLTIREIARRLGRPEGSISGALLSVRNRINRAIGLSSLLEKLENDENRASIRFQQWVEDHRCHTLRKKRAVEVLRAVCSLHYRPSGHEILSEVNKALDGYETPSSLFHLVSRMEQEGLLAHDVVDVLFHDGQLRSTAVFRITPLGRLSFQEWTRGGTGEEPLVCSTRKEVVVVVEQEQPLEVEELEERIAPQIIWSD